MQSLTIYSVRKCNVIIVIHLVIESVIMHQYRIVKGQQTKSAE